MPSATNQGSFHGEVCQMFFVLITFAPDVNLGCHLPIVSFLSVSGRLLEQVVQVMLSALSMFEMKTAECCQLMT